MDGALEFRDVTGKTLAEAFVQFWIVRLPKFITNMETAEINVAMAEAQPGFVVTHGQLIDPAAFLTRLGITGIKNHAITGLERGLKPH